MYRLIKHFMYIVLFSSLLSISANASEPDVKLGMWQWEMTMSMSGMTFPPIVYSSCLTKKDLVPKQSDTASECKIIEQKVSKNGVEWKMECHSEAGKSLSEGKIVYTKTTAKGKIKVTTPAMVMMSKISGHYTGGCK